MAVKKVKRSESVVDPVEANRAAPRSADPSVIGTNKPEAGELEEVEGAKPAAVGVPEILRKGRALVVTLPSSSFAPVKYGSFVLPAVSMTVDPAEDDDPENLVRSATDYLQKLQQDLFEHELLVYVARARRAHQKVREAFGED